MKTRGGFNAFLSAGGLNGTVPGAEVDLFTVLRTDQLHLEMIVIPQTLLNQDTAVTELAFGIILQLPIS